MDQAACRCHARAYRNTTQSNNSNNNSLQQWRHIEHNMPYLCAQRGTNEKALLGRESKVHSLSWQPKAATPATATATTTTMTASHFDYINAKHTHTDRQRLIHTQTDRRTHNHFVVAEQPKFWLSLLRTYPTKSKLDKLIARPTLPLCLSLCVLVCVCASTVRRVNVERSRRRKNQSQTKT